MPTEKKFDPHKGFHGVDNTDGDEEFLKVDRDPWEASASGQGYNARWDDNEGYSRGLGAYAADDEGFRNPSIDRTDESAARIHEEYFELIDNQKDQPAGPLLGGGGPVSRNVIGNDGTDWKGSGRKGPRYKNPLGAQGQGNMRKPR